MWNVFDINDNLSRASSILSFPFSEELPPALGNVYLTVPAPVHIYIPIPSLSTPASATPGDLNTQTHINITLTLTYLSQLLTRQSGIEGRLDPEILSRF